MNQTNCYRNRKSISIFVNVCKKLMPKILNDLQNKPVKILKKIPTKKQTKPHAQNPTYIYYIYIISIYCILMHIHAGPTSLCVLSSLSFLCVCALGGSVCVSLSCSTTTQTTCTTTNKCYNKIIWKKNILTRRPINNNIYIYVYIMYICVYIPLYMSYISSMRPTERPTDRPTARPPVWTDRSARPPARLARSKNQPNKTNNV